MGDRWFLWSMHITSFLPLWLSIILTIVWDSWNGICVAFKYRRFAPDIIVFLFVMVIIVASIWGIFIVQSFINQKERPGAQKKSGKVVKAKISRRLAHEFIMCYIMPLIAFDFTNTRDIFLFMLYFIIISFISLSNDNVYTNIFLELKKFRIYECSIEVQGKSASTDEIIHDGRLVISNENMIPKVGHTIDYYPLENDVFIHLKIY